MNIGVIPSLSIYIYKFIRLLQKTISYEVWMLQGGVLVDSFIDWEPHFSAPDTCGPFY